jgi:sugar phosphate isomerase/epimerase
VNDLRLSLEHMTVLGMAAAEIIDTAEQLDVSLVSLILDSGPYPLPLQSFLKIPALTAEIRRRLDSSPVKVHAAEGFLLEAETDFGRFARLLDIAAFLQVERVVALSVDPDRARTIENFGCLCESAAKFGLQATFEFVSYMPVGTIQDAAEVVIATGAPNAGISVDILHLTRSGGQPQHLRAPGVRLGAAQLCDGPLIRPRAEWEQEAMCGRLIPGKGEFPIADFLAACPAGLAVGVETPMGVSGSRGLMAAAKSSIQAARQTGRFVGGK